jgi:hypothetical protein
MGNKDLKDAQYNLNLIFIDEITNLEACMIKIEQRLDDIEAYITDEFKNNIKNMRKQLIGTMYDKN